MKTRNRLTAVACHRLMTLIEAEYTTSNLTDELFAQSAAASLGLPALKRYHVAHARKSLGIQPYGHTPGVRGTRAAHARKSVVTRANVTALEQLIRDLSHRLAQVEDRIAYRQQPVYANGEHASL